MACAGGIIDEARTLYPLRFQKIRPRQRHRLLLLRPPDRILRIVSLCGGRDAANYTDNNCTQNEAAALCQSFGNHMHSQSLTLLKQCRLRAGRQWRRPSHGDRCIVIRFGQCWLIKPIVSTPNRHNCVLAFHAIEPRRRQKRCRDVKSVRRGDSDRRADCRIANGQGDGNAE